MPAPTADFSAVTSQYDHASYTTGDPAKVTISGKSSTASQISVDLQLKNDDGATGVLAGQVVTLTKLEGVKLTGVVDSTGRVWTVSTDGLSASATA